jgi:hypothetical protein
MKTAAIAVITLCVVLTAACSTSHRPLALQ